MAVGPLQNNSCLKSFTCARVAHSLILLLYATQKTYIYVFMNINLIAIGYMNEYELLNIADLYMNGGLAKQTC